MAELTETDYAYLAGLVDGEGCLTIDVKKRGESRYYVGRCIIAMTGETVFTLQKKYKIGTVHSNKPRKPNHKPLHTWSIPKRELRDLLKRLTPYLICKSAQAATLLELFHLQATFGRGEVDYAWLADTMRELNKRGV